MGWTVFHTIQLDQVSFFVKSNAIQAEFFWMGGIDDILFA